MTVTATDRALNATVLTCTLTLDPQAPEVQNETPTGAISETQPAISAAFSEAVVVAQTRVEVDQVDVTSSTTVTEKAFDHHCGQCYDHIPTAFR